MKKDSEFIKKIQNFWYYNKVYVLLGVAILSFAGWRIYLKVSTPEPDYHIALVCSEGISDSDRVKIENTIGANGTDLNGDGKICVKVHLYQIDVGSETPNVEAVGGLDADLYGKLSGLFLVSDIDAFRAQIKELKDPVVPLSKTPALKGVGYTELFLAVRNGHPAQAEYQKVFDAITK